MNILDKTNNIWNFFIEISKTKQGYHLINILNEAVFIYSGLKFTFKLKSLDNIAIIVSDTYLLFLLSLIGSIENNPIILIPTNIEKEELEYIFKKKEIKVLFLEDTLIPTYFPIIKNIHLIKNIVIKGHLHKILINKNVLTLENIISNGKIFENKLPLNYISKTNIVLYFFDKCEKKFYSITHINLIDRLKFHFLYLNFDKNDNIYFYTLKSDICIFLLYFYCKILNINTKYIQTISSNCFKSFFFNEHFFNKNKNKNNILFIDSSLLSKINNLKKKMLFSSFNFKTTYVFSDSILMKNINYFKKNINKDINEIINHNKTCGISTIFNHNTNTFVDISNIITQIKYKFKNKCLFLLGFSGFLLSKDIKEGYYLTDKYLEIDGKYDSDLNFKTFKYRLIGDSKHIIIKNKNSYIDYRNLENKFKDFEYIKNCHLIYPIPSYRPIIKIDINDEYLIYLDSYLRLYLKNIDKIKNNKRVQFYFYNYIFFNSIINNIEYIDIPCKILII